MSRSYKRYPKVKQERLTKSDKIILNRRLRHLDVQVAYRGSQYKHRLPNWETWQYRWTWKDAVKDWYECDYLRKEYPTLESYRNYYESCVLRK